MDILTLALGGFDMGSIFASILGLFTGLFEALCALLTGFIPL